MNIKNFHKLFYKVQSLKTSSSKLSLELNSIDLVLNHLIIEKKKMEKEPYDVTIRHDYKDLESFINVLRLTSNQPIDVRENIIDVYNKAYDQKERRDYSWFLHK